MSLFFFWMATGFLVAFVAGSFFEWALHRFVMHRPLPGFQYPFRAHTLVHHHVFKADHRYHLIHDEDKHTIPMAWWNGPALVAIGQCPFLLVAWLTGHWGFYIGAVAAQALYYAIYEYIHWCMHLPRQRNIERSGIFFRLNGHHILHHRYMHKNFNVVFPLADLCLGTLLIRSRIAFAQPHGPAVPDLQPRPTRESPLLRLARFAWLCLRGVKAR
ncbi:MAG: fatty acid hydroxylase [Verrucomicrobia bacterium]|nr:fatty acid hydroxylase [Verrucomicrobiota bacterium]